MYLVFIFTLHFLSINLLLSICLWLANVNRQILTLLQPVSLEFYLLESIQYQYHYNTEFGAIVVILNLHLS